MDLEEAGSLARSLQQLFQDAHTVIDESRPTPELVARVTGHLSCALKDLVCVTQTFQNWEHASLQRGVDAYLAERGGPAWYGPDMPSEAHLSAALEEMLRARQALTRSLLGAPGNVTRMTNGTDGLLSE